MGKRRKTIRIAMPHLGDCLRISEVFDVSPQAVSNALNMKTDSYLAKKIRQYALNHGGVEIKEQKT